jgi:hypothetical protein
LNDLKNLLDVVGVFYGGTSKFDDFHNEMDRKRVGRIREPRGTKNLPLHGH